MVTRTIVPRPPGAPLEAHRTRIVDIRVFSDRQEMHSFGRSLVISASHSTFTPAGPLAIQCVRFSPVGRTDCRCRMNLRQVFEVSARSGSTPPATY